MSYNDPEQNIFFMILIFPHLDVSVGDVDAVEIVDGRADVPHDLRSLWEEKRKTHSLKPEAIPVSHKKRFR